MSKRRRSKSKRRSNFNGRSSNKPSMDFGRSAHRKGRLYFTGGYRA